MSAELVLFVPKAEKGAQENLKQFIGLCRNELTAYGRDLDFDVDEWDISAHVQTKGMGNKRTRLRFYTQPSLTLPTPEAMVEPFRSFAKAYIRYTYALRPVKSQNFVLSALRMVHEALVESGKDSPVHLDATLLNRVAQMAGECFEGSAFGTGNQIERIASFLERHRLIMIPSNNWQNPIKRQRDKATWPGVVATVSINQVNNRLGPKTGSHHETIFSRYGFTEPDGSLWPGSYGSTGAFRAS